MRLFAGPGVEITDNKNKFVVRTGVGCEIPIGGRWTLAPEFIADFADGGTRTFIGGLALGYEF